MIAPKLSDEDLAIVCCPDDPAKGAQFVAKLTPKARSTIEALEDLYQRIRLYEAGLGAKPLDARVCGPNEIREGRGPRQQRKKKPRR